MSDARRSTEADDPEGRSLFLANGALVLAGFFTLVVLAQTLFQVLAPWEPM